jgi:hypothetical protein
VIATDEQAINALRTAMATGVRQHHLDPAITSAALDRVDTRLVRTQHRRRQYLAIAAVCVVVAGVAVGVYPVRRSESRSDNSATPAARSACDGVVVTSALPGWARAGFSPNAIVNPHVIGASGQIIGVLFTDPLRSPPKSSTNNKILWVAENPGPAPLVIRARLEGSRQATTRTVPGGPGPSTIDLPAPGCWQLTLTWSGHTDTAALPYAP